jgi:hypothetical protein
MTAPLALVLEAEHGAVLSFLLLGSQHARSLLSSRHATQVNNRLAPLRMASYPPSYPTHFSPSYTPPRQLQPYLGPRAHLSLSWLSQTFLALILVFIALCFLLASLSALVADAKSSLTAACSGVEGAANVMVSLPHYMADGVNELNASAVSAVTGGAATVLDLVLQGISAIIM